MHFIFIGIRWARRKQTKSRRNVIDMITEVLWHMVSKGVSMV